RAGRELNIQAILGILRGLEAGLCIRRSAAPDHHQSRRRASVFNSSRISPMPLSASEAILEQQVETHVARNPSSVTEPMVVVVIKTLHDPCRSEIEKGPTSPGSARYPAVTQASCRPGAGACGAPIG